MVIAGRSHFDRKKKKNMTNIINFNKLSSKYHVTKTKIVKKIVLRNSSTTKCGDNSASIADFREGRRINLYSSYEASKKPNRCRVR